MSEQSLAVRQALGVERLGEIMWKSGYWQDTRSQAQAIVKILAGAELDFGPIASMNGIYIIEGRTTLSANLVGAAIQRSQRYRYRVVEHDDKHCIIDFLEIVGASREKLGTSKFDEGDARAAGLLGKKGDMWAKYPRNMYFSRALTNGARWYTPDVFGGPVYTPDELGAEVDDGGNVIEVAPTRERDVVDVSPRARMITEVDDALWKRWLDVRTLALQVGVVPPNLSLPIGYDQLVSNATMVKAQTEAKQAQLDREEAARAAARTEREEAPPPGEADAQPPATQDALPAPVQPADAWARNRALQAEAYAAGIRMNELPNDATPEEVVERNIQLQQQLLGR